MVSDIAIQEDLRIHKTLNKAHYREINFHYFKYQNYTLALTLKVPEKLQLYMDFMCIMWCIFATLACYC